MHEEIIRATYNSKVDGKSYRLRREIFKADRVEELDEVVSKNGIAGSGLSVFNRQVVVACQRLMVASKKLALGEKTATKGGATRDLSDAEKI